MKVALVNSIFYPNVLGGTETYLSQVVPELEKSLDLIIITGSRSDHMQLPICFSDIESSVRIIELGRLNLYPPWDWRNHWAGKRIIWHVLDLWDSRAKEIIGNCLKRERPDIVHTHNVRGLSLSVFQPIRSLALPQIHTLHDYFLLSPLANLRFGGVSISTSIPPNSIYQHFSRRVTHGIEAVIAPSQYILKRHLARNFFASSSRYVLRLPQSNGSCNREMEDRSPVARAQGTGGLAFLFVGTLEKPKGVDILLKAIRSIHEETATFHIVGRGRLESLVARHANEDPRINFHGYVSTSVLHTLYRNSDALVFPSTWPENAPMVICEAIGFDLPIIAANIGGVNEIVTEQTGWLVSPASYLELASAIQLIIDDPALLEEKRQLIRNVNPLPSLREHVRKLIDIYESHVEQR